MIKDVSWELPPCPEMTVGDVIKFLEKFDKEMRVTFMGGEIYVWSAPNDSD